MRNGTLLLVCALVLAGCGGGGSAPSSPLEGSYTGTWNSPSNSGYMSATIAGNTLTGTFAGGALQCTLAANGTASYDLSGTYASTSVSGSLWPTATGVEGSFEPVGSSSLTIFVLTRH